MIALVHVAQVWADGFTFPTQSPVYKALKGQGAYRRKAKMPAP